LGAHTVTHRSLAHSAPDEQRQEMDGSKTFLENLLGHPVHDFSYPYGMTSAQSPEIARAAGFRSAVTTDERLIARKIEKRNCWMLPRFIVRDWNGDEFAAKLGEWQLG
jgi:peptidoglycan/xylan/chitin deacetylase (PgdA/CDA1 family)